MNKSNLIKLLGIALVVAIISTGVFYGLFVGKLSSNEGSGKSILVAVKTLRPGTVLQESDLKPIPWPAQSMPKGSFSEASKVIGNMVYDTIGEDELITASRLSSAAPGSANIPPGMRAVSVHVTDSSGVLALLSAGHKVDVQVVVNRKQSISDTEVRTALQDLTVLSVRPQLEQSSQGQNLPVVTLLATPAEADVLATADAAAHIRLTLRNPQDQDMSSRSPLTLDGVMKTDFSAITQRRTPLPKATPVAELTDAPAVRP